jgi:Family of unknown function (DUF6922)
LKATINITSQFPKHLFWDMDYSKLSYKKDKYIIIPRALLDTTKVNFTNDILKLESLYPKKEIIKILKNTKELISNEVCLLVAKRYNITPFYRFKL